MHVGSIQFRVLGLIAVGTICSLIACSGGSGGSPTPQGAVPPPVIVAPAAVAIGSSNLTATVTNQQPNATYTWTISGGTIQGPSTGVPVSFTAAQAGALTLTCKATLDSQSASATAQVQVQSALPRTPQITAPVSASTGAANLGASVAQPEGDTSYQWTITGGAIISGANAASMTFSAGAVGTLTLSCTAANSVGSSVGQAQVQVVPVAPATPVITAPSQVTAQSGQNVASIPAQAGCSYAWTLSGGTISSGQGTTSVVFTAGGTGTMVLLCAVTNSASVSATAQQSITVLPAGQAAGYYGSRINADDLANQIVGWNTAVDSCNKAASCRLRAEHTGKLTAIRPKFIWSDVKSGYAAGNGGTIRIQIQTDDGTSNHFPSGVTLASLVYDQPITAGNHFPLLTFSTPASLVAGQLYHIVYTNVAADPTVNWVSLDHLYMWDGNSPVQPTVSNTDMAMLERNCSGAWVLFNRGTGSWTPTIELDYEDGFSQGQGYIQGYGQTTASGWVNPKLISGAKGVRETFTVSGTSRTVTTVSVRVNRLSGSSPLTVRVEKADGTLVGQGTVVVAQGAVSSSHNGSSWAKVAFVTALTLQAGQRYHLVLSSPSDTVHTAHALEKGSSCGYKPTTYFADGYAEFNSGSGWVGWDEWGLANRTDNDLQFYFETQ
ncbi:MAG: hypothetical protein HXX12_16385 [Geothrix sp.]|uniref:hypothetical protein n=1 Tax=Geothrix sp. TaxID=1962974 RepID=UPI00182AE579|nr:hypothetical protein [Geothrix sp.]NWJ42541.1 hypothetical protein [Geothrix sp.]WIL19498.1 MAG: hypothetical protein QOZ81_002017 [Geothrix sp.]